MYIIYQIYFAQLHVRQSDVYFAKLHVQQSSDLS